MSVSKLPPDASGLYPAKAFWRVDFLRVQLYYVGAEEMCEMIEGKDELC
jgi:hypothetical protein